MLENLQRPQIDAVKFQGVHCYRGAVERGCTSGRKRKKGYTFSRMGILTKIGTFVSKLQITLKRSGGAVIYHSEHLE